MSGSAFPYLTRRSRISRAFVLPPLLLLALLIPPKALHGQGSGADFLFGAPTGSVTFHAGFAGARAGSEVFSFTSELLTLNKSDFSAMAFGIEYARSITDNLDIFGGFGYSGSSERSEFRDWVDENQMPIEQDTRFARLPFLAGARFYLAPRGRSVGSYAWLPSAVAPHLSAGVGMLWYSFRQSGDFVDVEDNEIFTANLQSSGWAPMLHTAAGLDVSLSPGLILSTEARYAFARAEMSEDFAGFDDIDLSGLTATVGLKIRF